MRIAAVLPSLLVSFVLSLVLSGCLATAQVVIGPTVDERGGVGGMVRVRVSGGLSAIGLVATGEIAARQASPRALFGTGVGLFTHVDLAHDFILMANVRALLVGSSDWRRGSAFGGALALARYVKTKDEIIPKHHWQGWALGGELACDALLDVGSRMMVLSPGFVFEYSNLTTD